MRSAILVTALAAAASTVGVSREASATPLIAFSDGSGGTAAEAFLSDTVVNWAVSWTQSVASSNVRLSAVLSSNIGPTSADWFVTTQIGAGTSSTHVVHSGTYSPPSLPSVFDFNSAERTILATGLSFAPGTYFLVLDGPAGGFDNNANWVGDFTGVTTTLASGFSVGSYYAVRGPDSFAPSSSFGPGTPGYQLVFELDAVQHDVVPEPATLLLLGGGLLGLARVRRRK